jgi:predicted ATP-dependent serine protease
MRVSAQHPPVLVLQCDDLKKNQAYRHGHLKTLLVLLDACLRGGLSPGTITEIAGAAGMGKTQFCLCMAVISCLDSTRQGKVLYIDTENKFSGERLVEIARKRFPESFLRKGSMEDMLDRIIVKVPSSSSDLLQILQVRYFAKTHLLYAFICSCGLVAVAESWFSIQINYEYYIIIGKNDSFAGAPNSSNCTGH